MVQSSDIYWHILSKNKNRPTCITSWNNILKVDTNDQKWKEIFMLPLISVKEIRIRELQLKIIHRFYASQNKVSRWDDTVSNICKLCDVGIADIVHTFAECVIISNFWKFLTQWINDCTHGTLSLKTEQILFGITPFKQTNHMINHCILHAKYFIHLENMLQREPTLKNFKNFYKHKLDIERETYTIQNKIQAFFTCFNQIHNSLCTEK